MSVTDASSISASSKALRAASPAVDDPSVPARTFRYAPASGLSSRVWTISTSQGAP
jgi:hypothetical protein